MYIKRPLKLCLLSSLILQEGSRVGLGLLEVRILDLGGWGLGLMFGVGRLRLMVQVKGLRLFGFSLQSMSRLSDQALDVGVFKTGNAGI